jgi:hypothetical protein
MDSTGASVAGEKAADRILSEETTKQPEHRKMNRTASRPSFASVSVPQNRAGLSPSSWIVDAPGPLFDSNGTLGWRGKKRIIDAWECIVARAVGIYVMK